VEKGLHNKGITLGVKLNNAPLIPDPACNPEALCKTKNKGAKAHTLDSPLNSNLPGHSLCRHDRR
jgi:hypothetical protein